MHIKKLFDRSYWEGTYSTRSAQVQYCLLMEASWWMRHSSLVRRLNLRSLLHEEQRINSSRWIALLGRERPFSPSQVSFLYFRRAVLQSGTFLSLISTQMQLCHFFFGCPLQNDSRTEQESIYLVKKEPLISYVQSTVKSYIDP